MTKFINRAAAFFNPSLRKAGVSLSALLIIGGFATTAEAQAKKYTCPATVTLSAQGDLNGWSGQKTAIKRTKVSMGFDNGGRAVLTCHYGDYKLSRKAGDNTTCKAGSKGFVCTSNAAAAPQAQAPAIHSRGELNWSINQTADFDNGVVGANAGADLIGTPQGLASRGGAKFSGVVGSGTYSSCAAAAKTKSKLSLSQLTRNSRFCLITDAGRLVSVVVHGFGDGVMKVKYLTWKPN